MQVIFVSELLKYPVSALVDDMATVKFLYTIAKVVLHRYGIQPVFYGLFINGRIVSGDATPVRSIANSQTSPLYLQILIPELVRNMLEKSLEDQFNALKNISKHASDTRVSGSTQKPVLRQRGASVRKRYARR
ncbi:hypothetical protein GL50803_004873 [Giardia duodenalis]|uniref:Uncharacterized protein n=1 Tax=Giardia intestinalis (strain ATCC 50803 / WB clone C6) TaxID=184922 RepID=D3KHS8_GIAIC|nr:hypothetical protein GL50803_004873 [Giardia intestinalis]KAE8301985.1 hypothetical protein GL50803_004873 [Giardia intestinalis]